MTPSTSYDLKLYAFDSYTALGDVVNTFTPASGTVGDAVAVNYDATVAPTSNDQYAVTARWESNDAGVISFTVSAVTEDATYAKSARLSGFTISSVPEPGSLALLAAGLVGLLAYAWRKRK